MNFAFCFTMMLIIALSMCNGMLVFGIANGFSIYNNPWVDWGMVVFLYNNDYLQLLRGQR